MANEDARIVPSKERVLLGTYSNGGVDEQRRVRVNSSGELIVGADFGNITLGAVEIKDGVAGTLAGVSTATPAFADPGVTVREAIQNFGVVVLASGAQTTTQTQADQTNKRHRGMHLVVDVTVAGTGSITPKIQGKDINGIYYDLLVGSPITSTGTNVFKLYPGLVPVANAVADDVLPLTWRVIITANNANTITYSVGAQVLI